MFVRQPQFRNSNADVQIYYGDASSTGFTVRATWNKPPGVSHVYMMLIGPGGNGDGTNGGGSGAVTVWYGAAQNVPDTLWVWVGNTGQKTYVSFNQAGSASTYFQADSGATFSGGGAQGANALAASGFYSNTPGQSEASGASTSTFLSAGSVSGTQTSQYGYTTSRDGYFQLQPIIVGVGAANVSAAVGGVGCGGAISGSGRGGPGMVLIASW